MPSRRALNWLVLSGLCTAPALAGAAATPAWFLSLGAFDPKASTTIRLDALDGRLGTTLDLERSLNLPQRRVVPQATAGYRFSTRSSLEFNYLDLRRTGSRVIDQNITYGGVDYAFNTTVSTFSDVRTESLQYRYTLVDDYPWALSLSAGLHATRFTIGLSDLDSGASRSEDAQAPLPLVGMRAVYDLHAWQFEAQATYFEMTVNSIHGHLNNYALSVSHPLGVGLSIELGYTWYVLSLSAQRSVFTGHLRYAYEGPFLNLCYGCRPATAGAGN